MAKGWNKGSSAFVRYELTIVMLLITAMIVAYTLGYLKLQRDVNRTRCYLNQGIITSLCHRYHPRELSSTSDSSLDIEIDFTIFLSKGYLKKVPVCPDKGKYRLNEKGEVYCTYHGIIGALLRSGD